MKQDNNYLSPSIEILRIESQKVFAQSYQNETWNDGFISYENDTHDMGIW